MANEQDAHPTPAEIRLHEVGGRTVQSWEDDWSRVKNGFKINTPALKMLLGVYRATLDGKIMYIGESVEINKGLRKRLRDYSRKSDSAIKHTGAQKILEHIDDVECDVIVVGVDEVAKYNTKELKKLLLMLHDPECNSDDEVISEQRKTFYKKSALQKSSKDEAP